MTLDVWKKCSGEKTIRVIKETAWRLIDLQEKNSTRKLVDSLREQAILDELIEESRPTLAISQARFHPYLSTAFRCPPLKHGSRFGKKTESALWYGSLSIETVMAEKAFYRLAFINASAADFEMVTTPMALFSVKLKMTHGVKLHEQPFIQYKKQISLPTSYELSQLLGARMRANGLDGFTYISARDKKLGVNVGLFNMNGFLNENPDAESFQTWQCNTTKINVELTQIGSINDRAFTFSIKNFQINGRLPFPAV